MKVKIEIDTITFVRFWLVVIGFGLAGLLIWNARTALVIIGAAAFLALALNGPVSWLANKLPNRSRTLSTAIAFIVIVAILAAILFLAVPPIVQQTISFLQTLPDTIRTMSAQWKGFGAIVSRYHLESQIDQMVVSIQGNATSWLANFGQNFLSGVGTTMSLITEASLALVLTFLMLVEGPRWSRYFWGLYSGGDPGSAEFGPPRDVLSLHQIPDAVGGKLDVLIQTHDAQTNAPAVDLVLPRPPHQAIQYLFLVFAVGDAQKIAHQAQIAALFQQKGGGAHVFGRGAVKAELSRVFVNPQEKQGGLQRPDLDAPLLNRPEQERDSRADRLHPGPGGLDVAAMPVVIPEMDVGAALSQAAAVFHEPPLVAVAYDQFVHGTGVEVRVVGQVERRFVQGNEVGIFW